ncbi:unnamed protein product [Symbiodinium necroappetens]|uniref:Uncharacterized protein n=1 Tax=Symbiodinium necroappetens TaxID=1628268 RepID=A0A812WBZ1_9DINO|nr:unnamed protein product [Symbiodinium necroappetens]
MPAIFSVALAPALHDLLREPSSTEQVLAYFDDVYILASPDRVALLYGRLEDLIWQRARLRLNASKTRVWNAAGVLPDAVPQLAPDSAVWVGDPALIPEQRGLQYALRSSPPEATRAFATAHDDAVFGCPDTLLSTGAPSGPPLLATARAQLALRHGGMGRRCCPCLRDRPPFPAAFRTEMLGAGRPAQGLWRQQKDV